MMNMSFAAWWIITQGRRQKQTKITVDSSGPSNLLVDWTKSIVKLIIFMLFCVKSSIAQQQNFA